MGGVTISPNIRKEAVRLDINGNVIDPRTKQIIKPVEQEYVPPVQTEVREVPVSSFSTTETKLTISQQIEEAKKHLADLELQKQDEIKRMKEELARLESDV